jgi:hypothetical protein
LFGELAVRGATKIHFGIYEPMAATATFSCGIIFVKFYRLAAFWTVHIKNCIIFPIFHILAWAFHKHSPENIVCDTFCPEDYGTDVH